MAEQEKITAFEQWALSEGWPVDKGDDGEYLDVDTQAVCSAWKGRGDADAKGGIVLDAPALVGYTQFGKGVPWSTVIKCAQRHYQNKYGRAPTPEQRADLRAALLAASGSGAAPSLPAVPGKTGRWPRIPRPERDGHE